MYRFFHGSHHCGIWMTLQTFNSYNNFVKQWSIVVYILPRGNWSTELIKQHKVKQEIRYWMLISWILVYCFFYKKDDACQLKKKKDKGFTQKPFSVVVWPELYKPDKIISKVLSSPKALEIINFL